MFGDRTVIVECLNNIHHQIMAPLVTNVKYITVNMVKRNKFWTNPFRNYSSTDVRVQVNSSEHTVHHEITIRQNWQINKHHTII